MSTALPYSDYLDLVPKVECICTSRARCAPEAGLNIVLGTDDPAMFATTMGHLLSHAVRG